MFLWLSLYIIKEWEECFSAKRTSQIFPWEAKAGGRAEWPCGKCSALRGSSHCVAMADAPQCVICPKIPSCGGECGRHIIAEPFQAPSDHLKQNRDALAGCIPIHFIFSASALEACLWAAGVASLRICLSCGSSLRAVYFKYSLQSVRRISPLRMKVSCMPKAAERAW